MKRFTMYRHDVARYERHDENQMNPEDQPQFEGVEFTDGTVAVRWMTAKRSTAVWDSLADMLSIHGHPEYGSEMVWHDEQVICQTTGVPPVKGTCLTHGGDRCLVVRGRLTDRVKQLERALAELVESCSTRREDTTQAPRPEVLWRGRNALRSERPGVKRFL